ncbi:hypothetical protein P4O66_020767 [Electrophorus voltai]|uniref:Uncharacterized protein n=1 Tax=Electrophorus voltai TaxID=2609070 RepID=A0AAD9E3H5_9TELE|nr:hypothetical protein P4O66_020767 [Electrophorus voltai]
MTEARSGAAGSDIGRSYKDVVLANLRPDYKRRPPQNPPLVQLIGSLRKLMAQNPDGVSLTEVRRSCPLVFHTDVLKNFPSVRHLLASMPNIVRLQGVGVQTRVLPPDP